MEEAPKRTRGRPKGSKTKVVKPSVIIPAWDDQSEEFKLWFGEFVGHYAPVPLAKADYDALDPAAKIAAQKANYEEPLFSEANALAIRWFEFERDNKATYTAIFVDEVDGEKSRSLIGFDDAEMVDVFNRVFGLDNVKGISAKMNKDGSVREVVIPPAKPEPLTYDDPNDDPFYADEPEDE